MSARVWRLIGLQIVTGLVVAFVRHELETHQVVWDTFEQFLVSWIIHTVGLTVLGGIAAFAILRFHKFFLGEEPKDNSFQQVWYYILMTALVASLWIFFAAHYGPIDEEVVTPAPQTIVGGEAPHAHTGETAIIWRSRWPLWA
jgi:hypothetical protein